MSPSRTIEGINQLFERSGMGYTVDPIDEDFMQALFRAEGKKAGNPEFDPSLHDFDAGNSFWLGCRDWTGELIATVAARLLNAESFLESCRSYGLWYGDKIRVTDPLNIVFNSYERLPNQNAAFIGAGWVRPDRRGRGISWAMARLANYLALERWNPEWVIGMSLSGVTRASVPAVNFGFPRIDRFATGFRLPGFSRQLLFLLTMKRHEGVEIAANDLHFLEDNPELMLDSAFGGHLRQMRHRTADQDMEVAVIRAAG